MVLGILVPIAVLGLVILAAALIFRRGGEGLDLGPRGLLRLYLYVASLAGVVVLVIGLSGILQAGFAQAFGAGFVYGESPRPITAPCPPGAVNCPPQPPVDLDAQQRQQLERRRADDLIRGLTFAAFGAVFWAAHWTARRGVAGDDDGPRLPRGYYLLGTVVFGLATIILLPTGIYQGLSYLLLPAAPGTFRQGAGESLAGGVVSLPVWLTYLWLVVRDVRVVRALPPPPAA